MLTTSQYDPYDGRETTGFEADEVRTFRTWWHDDEAQTIIMRMVRLSVAGHDCFARFVQPLTEIRDYYADDMFAVTGTSDYAYDIYSETAGADSVVDEPLAYLWGDAQ